MTPKIRNFKPDLIIAIGGGGFIPARMLRTCLKELGEPTIRIYAIILSLYEDLNTISTTAEKPGVHVNRVQWIDYDQSGVDLINKNILIVDEVDDTRKTLHYALSELEKDLHKQCQEKGGDPNNTKFGIFVCHNKLKPKKEQLPDYIMNEDRYFTKNVPDSWICYPWESNDILFHQKMCEKQGNDL